MTTADALSSSSMPAASAVRGSQASYLPRVGRDEDPCLISFEDIAKYPGRACLGRTGAPTRVAFLSDRESLAYLGVVGAGAGAGGSLTQKLFSLSWRNTPESSPVSLLQPPSGVGEEDTLSEEEKLRRERTRQLETGVTSFEHCAAAQTLLCPVGNDLYVLDEDGSNQRKIVDGARDLPGSVLDPHMSKDGSLVVFVCERELYVCRLEKEADSIEQLTFSATDSDNPALTNGLADYIAMEEMERYRGFWISPDATTVAFEQSDESHIPEFRILHSGSSTTHQEEAHRYPFAGRPNPNVKLGLLSLDTKAVTWLELEERVFGNDFYLARVQWGVPDSHTQPLWVQIMNREQTQLLLLRFDVESDTTSSHQQPLRGVEVLREVRNDSWINLHDNLLSLSNGDFVWASERTGFQHLYKYDRDGKLLATLTSGDDWLVEKTSSSMLDEERGFLYFTGTKDGPKESHLYCVGLDGSNDVQRVTPAGGTHNILTVDTSQRCFVDSWSSTTDPFQVAVRSLDDGRVLRRLYDGRMDDARLRQLLQHEGSLPPPEFFDVVADDGQTTLHGALYQPDATSDTNPPIVVSTYGGPHAQTVSDSWSLTVDLRAQRLRAQGFAVLKLDNRGSARRGLAFETALRHDMGNVEVRDQVKGVEYVRNHLLLVDPDTPVGIYGWSYGGYLSAMCLARRPDVFRAAVAGAPVTDWDGYDTCYTERYMGTPQSNPDGYRRSAVTQHVDNLQGSLLLVHGLVDENVHFRHTARLINALIKARKHYELLLFPDERHVPRGLEDKVFMEERIASFLERCL